MNIYDLDEHSRVLFCIGFCLTDADLVAKFHGFAISGVALYEQIATDFSDEVVPLSCCVHHCPAC